MPTSAPTKTSKKPSKRPIGRKTTILKIEVSLELDDVVRVAGWDKANKMLNKCLAFASNNRSRVNLKIKKAKKPKS